MDAKKQKEVKWTKKNKQTKQTNNRAGPGLENNIRRHGQFRSEKRNEKDELDNIELEKK